MVIRISPAQQIMTSIKTAFVAQLLFACWLIFLTPVSVAGEAGSISTDSHSVVHGWPQIPSGRALGRASGVEIDSHNHVFVFHSADREWSEPFPADPVRAATIVVFDGETGELIAEWGQEMFVMPHGLSVDHSDNIWVTDVGRHQIFKFSHDGELLLTLGEDRVPGSDESHFNLPTDVAVLDDGGFFVSDGYGNSRVVKFSPAGEFQFHWGTAGSKQGQFDLPHGIARDNQDRIYVADRGNARIQVFDREGQFISEWSGSEIGRPYGLAIGPGQKLYVVDGGDQPDTPPDRSRAMRLGFDGKVEATFGRFGNYDGQFQMGHDIAVARDGAVYVVDILGARVQKFLPTQDISHSQYNQ
jgi:peptidylamidoglycolate lyase